MCLSSVYLFILLCIVCITHQSMISCPSLYCALIDHSCCWFVWIFNHVKNRSEEGSCWRTSQMVTFLRTSYIVTTNHNGLANTFWTHPWLVSPLTLIHIIFLHGADKVRSGVEVMRSWLLQAPQAEEVSLVCGAARKGSPTWDARVTCPALRLQVKSLQRCHRHFSLTTTWKRHRWCYLGFTGLQCALICQKIDSEFAANLLYYLL